MVAIPKRCSLCLILTTLLKYSSLERDFFFHRSFLPNALVFGHNRTSAGRRHHGFNPDTFSVLPPSKACQHLQETPSPGSLRVQTKKHTENKEILGTLNHYTVEGF